MIRVKQAHNKLLNFVPATNEGAGTGLPTAELWQLISKALEIYFRVL